MILAVGQDDAVELWESRDPGHGLIAIASSVSGGGRISSIAFNPRNGIMAVTRSGDITELWNVTDSLRPIRIAHVSGYTDETSAMTFSSDGRTMATTIEAVHDTTTLSWKHDYLVCSGTTHGQREPEHKILSVTETAVV